MPTRINQVDPATIREWRANGAAVVIDVREPHEWQAEHIPGSILIPLSSFDPVQVAAAVVPGKKLVVHCRSGVRCGKASDILQQAGFDGEINRMSGGILAWKQIGGDTETG